MSRPPTNRKMVRLNLALSEDLRETIDELREWTDAESRTEVIRRAIRVYERLLDIPEESELIIRDKDGTETTVLII